MGRKIWLILVFLTEIDRAQIEAIMLLIRIGQIGELRMSQNNEGRCGYKVLRYEIEIPVEGDGALGCGQTLHEPQEQVARPLANTSSPIGDRQGSDRQRGIPRRWKNRGRMLGV